MIESTAFAVPRRSRVRFDGGGFPAIGTAKIISEDDGAGHAETIASEKLFGIPVLAACAMGNRMRQTERAVWT